MQRCGKRAEVGVVGIEKERNFLTVLFDFLHPPMNADGGEGEQERIGDVVDWDFSIKEELKVLCNECFGGLQGPSSDVFVVGFGGLAPFRGTKPGVSSKGDPVKNGNVRVKGWQCGNVPDHPKSHLVGDHVATFGYVLIVLEGVSNDLDEIGFGGAW